MSQVNGLQAIRSVGGIVPPSMLERIRSNAVDQASLAPTSYHLASGENLRDAASRAWQYLRGAYTGWRQAQKRQPAGMDDTRAQTTRERWLQVLLREFGYGQVPTVAGGFTIGDQEYPVSHRWDHVPIHLLGPGVDLDKRSPGVAGAARQPQAMVQEFLNRTDGHLWAILSNGRKLRLLRDSTALSGAAYLEIDLEAIFDGELFSEFLLFWQLAHVSRLEKRNGPEAAPADCWLESWRNDAVAAGARALDQLRVGVEAAIAALGTGFIRHPRNSWLVDALRTEGQLSNADYQRALLRLVYRLLFVFVAEDRDALLDPAASVSAHERYAKYFSTARLRRLARVRAGGPHSDLWDAQVLVLYALGGDGATTGLGEPAIGLPALGGLFDPDRRLTPVQGAPDPDLLLGASLRNEDFLAAIRALSWIEGPGGRVQPVDYRNLDSEELGSVYESLLELVPRVDLGQQIFTLERVSGNERKTTGSYYTPPALVNSLLDTALDPLLDRAVKEAVDHSDAERRLLKLTVCDPACGSGHFLVAAARRIAKRLAGVRATDDEPTAADEYHALREVVGQCIYGVDMNDLAAELAKVSLWMAALEPGKPLGFLDAHIKVGNSLLGATPKLLADGVPDAAFSAILTGDDKKIAKTMKATNAKQRRDREHGWLRLDDDDLGVTTSTLAKSLGTANGGLAESANETRGLAASYFAADESDQVRHARQLADAWCAAFVWHKTEGAPPPPTEDWLHEAAAADGPRQDVTANEIARLAEQYRFLHWHIEFPDIFDVEGELGPDGWSGGFSCVLGNPPWEHTELKEQEFFAARDPEIASATGAKRKQLINDLVQGDPALWEEFVAAKRREDGVRAFTRTSGRYELTGRGRINTYAIFAEADRSLIDPAGRLGVILPTGIATDATTQYFFRDLVETASLASLFDFENAKPVFAGVHRSFKFCLLTLAGRDEHEAAADFAFFVHDATELDEPGKRFALTPDEIKLLNPNTGTCPVFRSRSDAEITLGIYRRVPILVREGDPDGNPWGVSFMQGLFNMTSDSDKFHTREELEADGWKRHGNIFTKDNARMLPLYEAKMLHHYDHRWATYERDGSTREVTLDEKDDSTFVALPRYWVAEKQVGERLNGRWDRDWLLGWRNVCRSTDERTTIGFAFSRAAVGHSTPLILGTPPIFLDALASFALDYVARQKLGGTNFTFNYFQQLAVPARKSLHVKCEWFSRYSVAQWISARAAELAWTAWDMEGFARDIGDGGPPFRWIPERRRLIRAELDAAMFHLYGLDRDEVDYVMDTFPIVRRKDEAAHGEYRTKRLILEVYDAMAEAIRTGVPYQSIVDPEPGQGPRHPESSRPDWATPLPLPEEADEQ
ncbi:Eco57I restriction-modification methylase domain-containing protein [Phytoactinopolyspora halotolerans]|uniref:site-specific DNA-methyltransferase (adenine-specific) n=1 Tax=Phytoactinopolyspora halotolerans TaxID=1981512 RepID=A0A6L9SAX3_9ACTN|nr:DNA methyltransferase [Phytoactinopolyspora halotolerans]NEE01150.1 N-6 DNA methylase [Phytoactinopolyspora halotolerans]